MTIHSRRGESLCKGIVPYFLSPVVKLSERNAVLLALGTFGHAAGIRFLDDANPLLDPDSWDALSIIKSTSIRIVLSILTEV